MRADVMRGARALLGAAALGGGAVLAQALLVAKRTPRLAPPRGERSGVASGEPRALELLVIGESSAIGVGASSIDGGLAPQLARKLSKRTRREVRWSTMGRVGLTAAAAADEVSPHLLDASADIVVLALGVNDVLRLRRPQRWYRDLQLLTRRIRASGERQLIVLSPVPPLWKFESLPQPLRGALGVQAFALDRASRRLARREPGLMYVSIPLGDQQRLLGSDRFHPSRAGYRAWAAYLARAIARRVQAEEGAEAALA